MLVAPASRYLTRLRLLPPAILLLAAACSGPDSTVRTSGDDAATSVDASNLDDRATVLCNEAIEAEARRVTEANATPPERALVGAFNTTLDEAIDWYNRDLIAAGGGNDAPPELVAIGTKIREQYKAAAGQPAALCWIRGRYDGPGDHGQLKNGEATAVRLVLSDGTAIGLVGKLITMPVERP